jgi:hypothetical protein
MPPTTQPPSTPLRIYGRATGRAGRGFRFVTADGRIEVYAPDFESAKRHFERKLDGPFELLLL